MNTTVAWAPMGNHGCPVEAVLDKDGTVVGWRGRCGLAGCAQVDGDPPMWSGHVVTGETVLRANR